MKFRKKPVVIEAIQYDGTEKSFNRIKKWCEPDIEVTAYNNKKLRIPTLEGVHDVSVGDWIIKGVKGEFYPCKPDIFEQTYDSKWIHYLKTGELVINNE